MAAPDTTRAGPSPPTLVLLPGMDGTGELFDPLVSALAGALPLQRVCYPVDRPMGYPELVAFVRAALPSDRPFVLLGESFSGPIAVALAAQRPPHLQGLILCCSFVRNPVPWLAWMRPLVRWLPVHAAPARMLAWFLLGPHATPTWHATLRRTLAQVAPAVMRARANAVLSVDEADALRGVDVPVLYVRAMQDRVVSAAAWRRVVRLKPATESVAIPGPHFLLQAAATSAAREILAWLAVSTGSSPVSRRGHSIDKN